jgi:nitrate/nitrite-specific signal transduction histidine kinase
VVNNLFVDRSRALSLRPLIRVNNWWMEGRLSLPRFGLSSRLLLIVIAVSLFGVLNSSLLLIGWHNALLIEGAELSLTELAAPIDASLQHAMLRHDDTMMKEILESVAQGPGVQQVRIIDENGLVRQSSLPSEIGQRMDKATPECQGCHDSETNPGSLATMAKTSTLVETSNSQYLLNVSPITNDSRCWGCHDSGINTLGILMIQAPVKDLNTQIREGSWHIGLAAVLTFALLVGLMVPILRRSITNPVAELSKGVAEISSQNLDYQVRISSHDEIGNLAEGLESMRKQLKRSRTEMEQRNRELAVLYQVALITGQLLEIDKILLQVLGTVVERLNLRAGIIYLWDKSKDRFERRVSIGHSETRLREIEDRRRMPEGDLTRQVARNGEALFVADKSVDPYFLKFWGTPTASSYVNIPIVSKAQVIGTIELTGYIGEPLTERQVEILKAVGHQVGIALDNHALLDETRRGEREASALYQLGTKISASLELNQVVEAVAEGACHVLTADISIVALVEEERQALCVRAVVGAQAADWKGLELPLDPDRLTRGNILGKITNFTDCPPNLPAPMAKLVTDEKIKSLLSVPLWRANRLHGIVAVLTRDQREFKKEDIHLLMRLAQQVIIAIENARLYQQMRYLAVLEERDRLAREMHDNLAQELGYLDLKATITRDLLANGQVEQARESLLELKRVTREAYGDTREAIFSLRNVISWSTDMVPVLREYLAEYRVHYGLDTRVIIEDESLARFKPEAGVQIQRIIKEALTNVRKHAKASRAWIRFEREGDRVRITVEDDGRGFDPGGVNREGGQRYGIQIMRERAEGIGGSLEFISQANQGTRVVIRIPASAIVDSKD